jgi:hypothetical protein
MKYLVVFTVIHPRGQLTSRAFIERDQPITENTIQSWETVRLYDDHVRDYGKPLCIRVTGFQPLAG